jgi:hypothetical protein
MKFKKRDDDDDDDDVALLDFKKTALVLIK